jgi:hypothetical protein
MTAMDVLHKVLVVLHLLGMAAVVGGWIAVRSARTVTPVVLWGARAQLITGLLLVALASMDKTDDWAVNSTKIAVKLVISIVVVAAAEVGAARSRRGQDAGTLLDVAGGAAVVNVLVAALW